MYISDLYEDELEISIKVVIVGNGAVGKSSMIQRYCRGIFTNSYKKTIGVDFLEKQLRFGSEEVRLMLWDTAGQEEFDAITKAYYRGAQACVVAFSTTDRASFDAVRKWKKKVEDECGSIPMVLVQNKIDLLHESEVSPDEVERLAKEYRMRLYRTSVKEDLNVVSVFQHLAENYVNKVKSYNDLAEPSPLIQIGASSRPYGLTTTNGNGNNGRTQLYTTTSGGKNNVHNGNNGYTSNNGSGGGYIPSSYSSNSHPRSRLLNVTNGDSSGGGGRRYYTSYARNGVTTSGYASFSPQDYLNNPMFDSLNHRRYWPTSVVNTDRTITLRPLVAPKKNAHKRIPMRNSCKVLS